MGTKERLGKGEQEVRAGGRGVRTKSWGEGEREVWAGGVGTKSW